MPALLITQCLQNDFVQPIDVHESLPNSLHIGFQESKRLIGEYPKEGMLMQLMTWAYAQPAERLRIINIRDWHNASDPLQRAHLQQFGEHCLANTPGAEFVFEAVRDKNKDLVINASGLNDFVETPLAGFLDNFKGQPMRVGVIGVWTEAKITYLAYELTSRYPTFEIAICNALTASSSTHMHFVSLEQLRKILGVHLFPSVTEFAEFLNGDAVSFDRLHEAKNSSVRISFETEQTLEEEDRNLVKHLYRNSKTVEFKVLDGGFSGNIVAKAKSTDIHGHEEVATVLKIGARNPISRERDSFERIRDILGNNAPHIVDYAETEGRAGIKYRYASMFDEKVTTFQNMYGVENNLNKLFYYLDIIFKKQLGRFYKAATSEKLDLLAYYDFKPKYAESVLKKCQSLAGDFDQLAPRFKVEGHEIYNLYKFYREDLRDLESQVVYSHYLSYVHGDLNGANIIIDAQENVWLIDFFHTHRGHVLKDLIKLENDLIFIFMQVNNQSEFDEACKFIDVIQDVQDLWDPLPEKQFKYPQLNKAYQVVQKLRSYYQELVNTDRNPYQLFAGQLRYSVHTMSFDECNLWQKKLALYASGKLAQKVKDYIIASKVLRIDYIEGIDQRIGMTILPGRKDRKRDLREDLETIRKQEIKNVICLVASDEFEKYGVPELLDEYKKAGITVKHVSVVDQGVPTLSEVKELTKHINQCTVQKEAVMIHCIGGLGRTGLLAACYLKEYHKLPTAEAIKKIRAARSKRAIETEEQERFVEGYV